MRHRFETLERAQRLQRVHFAILDQKLTFTAATHSSRSTSEMDLHSRLTRGSEQGTAFTVVMNVRRRAKNTFFARPMAIMEGPIAMCGRRESRREKGNEKNRGTSSSYLRDPLSLQADLGRCQGGPRFKNQPGSSFRTTGAVPGLSVTQRRTRVPIE